MEARRFRRTAVVYRRKRGGKRSTTCSLSAARLVTSLMVVQGVNPACKPQLLVDHSQNAEECRTPPAVLSLCIPGRMRHMQLTIRLLREEDGRWIGDVAELPGVTVYGSTPEEATLKAKALALRVIAEEIEHGEMKSAADSVQFCVAA